MDWEKFSKKLKLLNWTILLILGSVSFFAMDSRFTLGLILGGLIIIANFSFLGYTIRRAFSQEGTLKASKMSLIAKHYFRLALLGIIIYILITKGWVDPVGLTVGLSIVVISVFSIAVRAFWKSIFGEAL